MRLESEKQMFAQEGHTNIVSLLHTPDDNLLHTRAHITAV